MEKVDVLGVKINKLTTDLALKEVKNFLISDNKNYIATVNPEFVMAASKSFGSFVRGTTLNFSP